MLRLSQTLQRAGRFPVAILNWASIVDLLAEHPEVLRQHYSDLAPTLPDLAQGASRRIARELPGATVSVKIGGGRAHVSVLSRSPYAIGLHTTEARERIDEVERTGTPARFEPHEFRCPRSSAP